jgi:hypothetical protein
MSAAAGAKLSAKLKAIWAQRQPARSNGWILRNKIIGCVRNGFFRSRISLIGDHGSKASSPFQQRAETGKSIIV